MTASGWPWCSAARSLSNRLIVAPRGFKSFASFAPKDTRTTRKTVECGSEKTTQNVLGRGTAFTDGTPRHPTLGFLMERERELRDQTVQWVSDTDTSNGGIPQSHNLER